MKEKSLMIPFIALIVLSLTIVGAFFLPYATLPSERKEWINAQSEETYVQEIGMTEKEASDMSLVKFCKAYATMLENSSNKNTIGNSIVYIVMFSGLGLFALLNLLFSCLKKPVPIIVFSVLQGCLFFLMAWELQARAVISENRYQFGIAYYIFLVVYVLMLAAAIWLLAVKIKNKKAKQPLNPVNGSVA